MYFSDLLEEAEREERVLRVYNYTGTRGMLDVVSEYLSAWNVDVELCGENTSIPGNTAVLGTPENPNAASVVDDIYTYLAYRGDREKSEDDFGRKETPEVISELYGSTFEFETKASLVTASHEVEGTALRRGEGTVYSGFQRLPLVEDQWGTYSEMASLGIDVHVYGSRGFSEDTWRPPDSDETEVTFHVSDSPQIQRYWFVVFDGGDGTGRALLAEEREPRSYYGFLTDDYRRVTRIVDVIDSVETQTQKERRSD
ncbi:DICT sensory domain-containing protein [Halorutilales archaeon Cl-col2-1]